MNRKSKTTGEGVEVYCSHNAGVNVHFSGVSSRYTIAPATAHCPMQTSISSKGSEKDENAKQGASVQFLKEDMY